MRLLQWEPRRLEELHSWELTLLSGDWRERKAPMSPDPARAQGVSAAGRAQFSERLTENRHRFLGECGRLASRIAVDREWADVIAFSSPQCVDYFRGAFPSTSPDLVLGGEVDLIAESAGSHRRRRSWNPDAGHWRRGSAENGKRAGSESLVRRALATGARITPVSGDAADLLAPTGGVAALLRY